MFNKNDPLISAVQEVMKRNHAEREAAKVVNEKFGVYDRKALPHERQGEWDAAFKSVLNESDDMGPVKKKDNESVEYEHKTSGKRSKFTKHPGDNWKVVKEELKGNQHRIDVASSTGEKKPDGKLTKHDFEHLRSMKEENLEEREMTSSEKTKEKKLKAKLDPSGMKASMQKQYGEEKGKNVYFATIRKKAMKEDNEGFNNRHGLSENASAEKQAVAVLNEDTSDYMDQEFERRGLQPPGGGMPGGGALKKTRVGGGRVRIDPGLKYINTGTGKKLKQTDIPRKKRTFVKKNSQTAQQQGPAKPPSGTFLDNLARGRRNVGTDRPAAPSLAAGAARRPPGTSTVPQIRQQSPSSGSNLPQGPWGGINRRGGARNPISSTLTAGAARRPAGQSAPPMRQQGSMLPPPKSSSRIIRRGGSALAAGAALDLATSSTPVGNQPPAAAAATRTSGPSFEKTGRGTAPSVSNTGTKAQTNLKPANVMSAKPSFEFSDKQREAAKAGKASIKDVESWAQSRGIKANPGSKEILRNYLNAAQNKTMKTDVKAGGTAATPTQTAAQSAEMKFKAGMAQRSGPSAPVKPTVSSSPAPNVQPARNSTLAAPSATAATTMATATKAAGQMAVDRMKAQNLAKSQTSSMFGGSVNKPKPFDQFQDKGKYAGDMRDTKGPAAAERLANPTFVPTPSPGSTYRRNSTLAAPSAVAAGQNVDTAKKPAASVTPQMSQDISSLKTDSLPMPGNKRSFVPRFAERELKRRENIQTVKGA